MPETNKEVEDALRNLETKHRAEDFLKKIGASDETAALLASHPDQIKLFKWDGVNLTFGKSDLAAVDDPAAKAHFTEGPFKALFTKEPSGNDNSQVDPDPALVESARTNITARGRLLRSLNGDVERLNTILAAKGDGNDKLPNGHGSNPFLKLRDPRTGKVDPVVEKRIADLIVAIGHKKATDIAKGCVTPDAPFGLSLTGVPLRRAS